MLQTSTMSRINPTTASPRLERVIREAETLFLREGFLHFSTAELAHRLSCSKRTLYDIAPDRDSFFELIIARRLLRLNDNLVVAAEAAPDRASAVTAILDATIETFGAEATRFLRDIMLFPGGVRLLPETESARLDLLEHVIAAGVQDGAFGKVDPSVAAYAMFGAARRMSETDFLAKAGISWPQALTEMFRIVSYGLLATDAPARRNPAAPPRLPKRDRRRRDAFKA
jgi:AcrR family transcriptional regulator